MGHTDHRQAYGTRYSVKGLAKHLLEIVLQNSFIGGKGSLLNDAGYQSVDQGLACLRSVSENPPADDSAKTE